MNGPPAFPILLPMASKHLIWLLGVILVGISCAETPSPAPCVGSACDPDPAPPLGPESGLHFIEGPYGRHASVAIADDGAMFIVAHDHERKALVVGMGSTFDELIWIDVDGTEPERDVGYDTTAVLGTDGALHILYRDLTESELRHARLEEGGSVSITSIGPIGQDGTRPDMAIAADGAIHICHHLASTGALRHVARSVEGTWSQTDVPPAPIPGCEIDESCDELRTRGTHCAIRVRPDGPVIAYYDDSLQALALAAKVAGQWIGKLVDGVHPETGINNINVGRWPALQIDAFGNLSIAYHDATSGALRFAASAQGQIKVQVIDSGQSVDPSTGATVNAIVGVESRLVTTADGRPLIYSRDATHATVQRAERIGEIWTLSTLDLSHPAGFSLSAAWRADVASAAVFESWEPFIDAEGDIAWKRRLVAWID